MKLKPHLFPHSYLPERMARKIVSFFGPVRIYQPWFMNVPEFFKDIELDAVNPPDELKPKEDVKAILSGYRTWAEQNHDRSYKEIAKFGDNAHRDENALWEIRRLLKTSKPAPSAKEQDLTLKWHLILYLASEVERQNFEVVDMMNRLKEKNPLAGVLQDPGESKGFFADMPDLTSTDMSESMNILWIMEAWFGLFGKYLKENEVLITCSSHAMDWISSQWDDKTSDDKTARTHSLSFRLSDLSLQGDDGVDDKKNLHETEMRIRDLVLRFREDPDRSVKDIQALIKGLEERFPLELSNNALRITLRYFPCISCEGGSEGKDLLRHIAGKTIVLAE
jgi:hypothetical protein